ncbi:MAG: ABC transporter ATP-binding protein [Granulosicoccus sp.]
MSSENTSSPGIKVDAVSLQLQSHQVFDSLSLDFAGGQCHCVLGRSGVGKSSLLNILSGSIIPQRGSVSSSNGGSLHNQVAHMFQEDGLLPWLPVLDNVQLGLRLRGESSGENDERAMELLSAVGLVDWASHYPCSLSGGMRQRVALARTLMERRPIILMDEPFSRLDAITRDELQVLSCQLLKGCTVVLVTHDPSEALRVGHTVTVLHTSLPNRTTTFVPQNEQPRARTDAQFIELTADLWSLLATDAFTSEELERLRCSK